MFRTRTAARLVAAVSAVAVVLPATGAYADVMSADGDGATPIAANALAFGSDVCTDTEVTKAFAMAVKRDSNGNSTTFKNGSIVTMSIVSAPAGITATLPAAPGNKVTLPTDWENQVNGQTTRFSDAVTGSAKLKVSSPRTYVGWDSTTKTGDRVLLRATGTAKNGSAYTKDYDLSVTGTVSNCTPPDTTDPELALPDDFAVEATSAAGAEVTYSASATDATPQNPEVDCDPASGTVFGLGATTVTCSTADTAGNTAEGSFVVTVEDTTDPVLSGVPSNITREATSASGAAVTFTAPTATDTVDGSPTVGCATTGTPVRTSGSTFPLGTTIVTCTATDDAGNADTDTFTITVEDTTGPSIDQVADLDATEATGGSGATITYTTPAATDLVDGPVDVTCDPVSGSTFPVGETPVTCSATDAAGNPSEETFTVLVQDTTEPMLFLPESVTEEATSPAGASVTYTATAEDIVDGELAPSCEPASETTFALGETRVNCSVADAAGNDATGSFPVTVQDTIAPDVAEMIDLTREATSAAGAPVTFTVPTASDAVGAGQVDCASTGTPVLLSSGSTFPLGKTTVVCSATDAAGNEGTESFTITVEDNTAPVLNDLPSDITAEASSANGATVTYTAPGARDLVDSTPTVECTPTSGSTFALGSTSVECTATDAAGNTSDPSNFNVTVVDTTGPSLSLPASAVIDATDPSGAAHTYTASATDLVDPSVTATCTPVSGSTFAIGTTTVSCTATDDSGNEANGDFTVTVRRSITGFSQPVDTGRTLNLVKAGSTLPLKFEVFAGKTELTATDIFKPLSVKQVDCESSALLDEVEQTTTGNTALRYDATSGQYIWNWKTPSKAGACFMVTVETLDGALKTAQFKLR